MGLEVAAAGGHRVLICGPPGSDNTLLARFFPSIRLRPLVLACHTEGALNGCKCDPTEALDVTRIYSVTRLLPYDVPLIRHRSFHVLSPEGDLRQHITITVCAEHRP